MKITIHRPEQIGGQITKISTNQASIIIDLGHNLPNNKGKKDPFDNREAIEALAAGCDAILYTHYHGDHVGLCQHVPSSVPQYIGPIAKRVMECKYEKLTHARDIDKSEEAEAALSSIQRMKSYKAKESLKFGNIKVTPYFVSHSAADSHMFLIEVEGKRILHTGDFRGHGLLSKGLDPVLKKIKHVDVLIIEGTMLSRSLEQVKTEHNIGVTAEKWMREFKYVFVHCSSTDMERLTVFKDAKRRAHPYGPIVTDNFQKKVLEIFSQTAGKKTKAFDFGKVYSYSTKNITLKDWMKDKGFVMFIRSSDRFNDFLDDIFPLLNPEQTLFIYSMWSGYIKDKDAKKDDFVILQNRFKTFGASVNSLHTSGHAALGTLQKVCEKLKPSTAIIPIHRECNTDLRDIGLSEELQDRVVTEDYSNNNLEIHFCSE